MAWLRKRRMVFGLCLGACLGCGDKTECVNPRPSMAGCCTGHGGAEKCGEGKYRFQGERLVCDDGTLSDTCRR